MRKKYLPALLVVVAVVLIGLGFVIFNSIQKTEPARRTTVAGSAQPGSTQQGPSANPDESPSTIPEKRSDSELLDAISTQKPELVDSNKQPSFAVVKSVKTTSGWYVVTVLNKDPTVGTAKIIMKDSGSGLVVVAGPGTSFNPDVISLPDEVWKLLQ